MRWQHSTGGKTQLLVIRKCANDKHIVARLAKAYIAICVTLLGFYRSTSLFSA